MKLVYVLSGGGARGFAHLGALSFFEQQGLTPSLFISSSVGSLVAVCIAAGKSAKDTADYFLKHNLLTSSFHLSTKALLNSKKIVSHILKFAGVSEFKELKIPLQVTAMNINTGKEKVFKSGPLLSALQASIALPLVCAPVEIGKQVYVDGSVLDVLPSHLVPKNAFSLAIDVSLPPRKITPSSSVLSIISNAIIFTQTRPKPNQVDLLVRVEMNGFTLLEYSNESHKKMYQRGFNQAKKIYNKSSKKPPIIN